MFVGRVGPVDRRSDGERSRRPREFEYIRYETIDDGRIAAITLDRPKQRNAQTRGMLVELGAAFELAEADDTVRVVILRAAGPAFSAGHDLGSADDIRERSPGPDQHPSYRCNGATFGGVESRNRQEWHYYFENTKRWRNLRKITIAQVHGAVLSAGLMLAWCCDLIVASEDTVFADVVGTRLGMCGVEYFGHPWEFGPRKTKELLLTGDCIGADEAHALGMVSKVFPADELATSTIEFARRIAKVPTMAALLIKESVNQTVDAMGFSAALDGCFIGNVHARVIQPSRGAAARRPAGHELLVVQPDTVKAIVVQPGSGCVDHGDRTAQIHVGVTARQHPLVEQVGDQPGAPIPVGVRASDDDVHLQAANAAAQLGEFVELAQVFGALDPVEQVDRVSDIGIQALGHRQDR